MPKYSKEVNIPGKTADELFEQVSSSIDRFLSKTPIGNYTLDRNESSRLINLDSKMATLTLSCGEGVLKLDGKLSLMAAPFKSKLDEGIDKWIAKTFSS